MMTTQSKSETTKAPRHPGPRLTRGDIAGFRKQQAERPKDVDASRRT